MAESTVPEASNLQNLSSPEIKQIESQLVSLNFVLKNTQTEVIKLQKTLARQQSRNDELDKRNERLEQELHKLRVQQADEARFRSRVWLYQGGIVLFLIMLSLYVAMKPMPISSQTRNSVTSDNI